MGEEIGIGALVVVLEVAISILVVEEVERGIIGFFSGVVITTGANVLICGSSVVEVLSASSKQCFTGHLLQKR